VKGAPGILDYASRTVPTLRLAHLAENLAAWYWGLGKWLSALWDTVVIALLATLLGSAGACLLCFSASRNLVRRASIVFVARRLTEVARAVPDLVYALVFVFAFGLGPLPGVLAIAVHTAGALGKLFAEVNESVAPGPLEGLRACGANWWQVIRYAVMPQVLPNFLSYALLRLEINVRSASVVGFVGAGGLGQELMFVIRQFLYEDVSAIVLLLLVTVAVIDMLCERVRHSVIGQEAWA
jgi:phosphonate transport system permease protein